MTDPTSLPAQTGNAPADSATPGSAPIAPVRWGLWGTGWIADRFATDARTAPGASIVAVGSRTETKGAAFAATHGLQRSHVGLEALLADDGIDAVYIATPHPDHAASAIAALEAGKPTLVEKPFTMDAPEARRVAHAARAAGVFCMEAMWARFLPHMVRIRELLAEGALGRVTSLYAEHGQWFPLDASHRLYSPELGGGALLDLGIYPISFANMVLGPPVVIGAQAVPAFTGVDAQDSIIYGYTDGAQAVLHTTLESATPTRAWIGGTEGSIDIDPDWYTPTGFTLRTNDGRVEHFAATPEAARGGLGYEAAEVGRCLAAGWTESPILPLDETVAIMEQLDRIRRITGVSTHPV